MNPFDSIHATARRLRAFVMIAMLAAAALFAAPPAHAQLWVPLQDAHTGNWFDPAFEQTGEGLMPSVEVRDDGTPLFFAGIYLRDGNITRAWFAQGVPGEAWTMFGYHFAIHHHIDRGPTDVGWLLLKPVTQSGSQRLDWTVSIDADGAVFERSGQLHQLLRPIRAYGWCGIAVSYPRPPAAPAVWCHE
jgi:hypothetical protein